MSRSLRVRQPRTANIRRLHEIFESALEPGQRRRAQAILLYAAGLSAVEIARLLEVHAHTIYADLHAFDIYGVTAVAQFINLCSAQILAEKLTIFAPFQNPSPAKT